MMSFPNSTRQQFSNGTRQQFSYRNGQQFRKNASNFNTTNGYKKTSLSSPKGAKVTEVFNNKLKIFIKNIPNDGESVKSRIRELLEPCGEIVHEWYFSRRRGAHSVHTALIVLKTEGAAQKALEIHGSLVEGRHIIVSTNAQYSANTNGIHIKNLSWGATEEDLWSLFETTGKILFININNPVNIEASNQPLEGEVIFETEEEVKEALFFDNAEIHGLPINISRISRETKDDLAGLAIHVSGLPQDVTKEKVIQFFDKCGVVRMVKVNFKFLTAVVHFTSVEGVKAALQLDGRSLDNNRLSVRPREGEVFNLDLENPVYLYNIPESVRDIDIFIAFQECGHIIEVRFLRRKTANSKKRAVIQFKYPDSIAKAIELDGLALGGEPVSVSNSEKCFSSEETRQDDSERSGSSKLKFKNKKRNRPRNAAQTFPQISKRNKQN